MAENITLICSILHSKGIPVVAGEEGMCDAGEAVVTLGVDYYALGVQTAQMAIKVLEGSANTHKVAFVKGKWCGDDETVEKLKDMRITIRAIPFEQSGSEGVCLVSGKKATLDVIYARSY